jgi:hypothetical protein
MVVCRDCAQEMLMEVSCLSHPIALGGRLLARVRWGDERESRKWRVHLPCRDCGTPIGGVHHMGCCMEQCPACSKQAICCGCFEARALQRRSRCHHHRFPRPYRFP